MIFTIDASGSLSHISAEWVSLTGQDLIAASDLYTTGGRRREYRDHRLEWMVRSGGVEVVLAGLREGNIRFSWP
ncbi:hypothetical protein [Methylobacterium sp. J-077]|uniref:hypothetical protein n=1 Tax=Methylobacterium sp. J-077 TaxID=2836656 RepID=UPI001FBC0584|nr:hypothetical protein [Methylobacterium sp. J-077]MCJ2125211.1 hypothetical protein [Methylobacterium sp. J-077]